MAARPLGAWPIAAATLEGLTRPVRDELLHAFEVGVLEPELFRHGGEEEHGEHGSQESLHDAAEADPAPGLEPVRGDGGEGEHRTDVGTQREGEGQAGEERQPADTASPARIAEDGKTDGEHRHRLLADAGRPEPERRPQPDPGREAHRARSRPAPVDREGDQVEPGEREQREDQVGAAHRRADEADDDGGHPLHELGAPPAGGAEPELVGQDDRVEAPEELGHRAPGIEVALGVGEAAVEQPDHVEARRAADDAQQHGAEEEALVGRGSWSCRRSRRRPPA